MHTRSSRRAHPRTAVGAPWVVSMTKNACTRENLVGPHDNERRERWVSTTLRGVHTILSALLDGEISILVAFATKIVKQHP